MEHRLLQLVVIRVLVLHLPTLTIILLLMLLLVVMTVVLAIVVFLVAMIMVKIEQVGQNHNKVAAEDDDEI